MRRPEGFNLAFLDIMACGLGAVVLILVLLKNQEGASAEVQQEPVVDVAALEQQISKLTNEVQKLQDQLDSQNSWRGNGSSYSRKAPHRTKYITHKVNQAKRRNSHAPWA